MKIAFSILIITVSLSILWSPKADAQTRGGYIGISGVAIDTGKTEHMGTNLHAGVQPNEFLGFEVRGLITSGSELWNGVTVDINNLYGVYATLSIPVSDSVYPYLIVGRSKAEASVSYQGRSASVSDSGTSYGIGARFTIREAWEANIEYMEVLEDFNTLSAGIRFVF